MGDAIGRKRAVELSFALYMIGGSLEILLLPLTQNFSVGGVQMNAGYMLYVLGRTINGMSTGSSNVTVLMYLLEVVPKASLRGIYNAYFQICITLGIVAPNFFGLFFKSLQPRESDDGIEFWSPTWNKILARLIVGVPVALSVLSVSLLVSLPESPVYLLLHPPHSGEGQSAENDLDKVLNQIDRDFSVTPQPVDQPHPRRAELEKVAKIPQRSVFSALLAQPRRNENGAEPRGDKKYVEGSRRAILSGILLVLLIQFTGVNVIFSTANNQLVKAGFTSDQAYLASFGLSCWNFLITLPMISLIEKSGRTTLLQLGAAGAIFGAVLAYIFTTIYTGDGSLWLMLLGLFIYVTAFAMGIGSVMFLYINEILPSEVRSQASGIIIASNWTFAGLVVVGGALLSQAWVLTIMIGASTALLVFACVLPETRGLPFGVSPFTTPPQKRDELPVTN